MISPDDRYYGTSFSAVMPGHSRPKDGVASLAYVPGIPFRWAQCIPHRDGRDKPGHDALIYRLTTQGKNNA